MQQKKIQLNPINLDISKAFVKRFQVKNQEIIDNFLNIISLFINFICV